MARGRMPWTRLACCRASPQLVLSFNTCWKRSCPCPETWTQARCPASGHLSHVMPPACGGSRAGGASGARLVARERVDLFERIEPEAIPNAVRVLVVEAEPVAVVEAFLHAVHEAVLHAAPVGHARPR